MGPRQATETVVDRAGHSARVATKRSDALNMNVLPRVLTCSSRAAMDRCRTGVAHMAAKHKNRVEGILSGKQQHGSNII